MNRLEAYCQAFGWTGGTIHQIAKETGVDVNTLLYGESRELVVSRAVYGCGWIAGRHDNHAERMTLLSGNRGDTGFWLGVRDGIISAETAKRAHNSEKSCIVFTATDGD
jgi:hypothetical protein